MCAESLSENRVNLIYPLISALATCLFAIAPSVRSISLTGSSLIFNAILSIYIGALTWYFLKKKSAFSMGIPGKILSFVFLSQIIAGLFVSSSVFIHGLLSIPHVSYSFAEIFITKTALIRAGLILLSFILFGGAFCGHLCFLGTWENGIGYKSKFRYLFLVLFVVITSVLIFFSATFFLAALGTAFFIFTLFIIGIISILKKKRFHCSIFCPLVTFREIFNRVSPFKIITQDQVEVVCPFGAKDGSDHALCVKCSLCINSGKSELKFFGLKNAFEIFIVSIAITHGLFINLYRV